MDLELSGTIGIFRFDALLVEDGIRFRSDGGLVIFTDDTPFGNNDLTLKGLFTGRTTDTMDGRVNSITWEMQVSSPSSDFEVFGSGRISGLRVDLSELIDLAQQSRDPNFEIMRALAVGDDRMVGSVHGNTLQGHRGDDFIFGAGGRDTLEGGQGNDEVRGGRGGDFVAGNKGADALYGQAGRDTLNGGLGNDDLHGGRGADVFLFGNRGRDTVHDFGRGNDELVFDDRYNRDDMTAYDFARQHARIEGDDTIIQVGRLRVTLEDTRLDALALGEVIAFVPEIYFG